MKAAEIRRRRPEDAGIERLARVYALDAGGPAQIEVLVPELSEGLRNMLAEGIIDEHGRFLTLEDGDAFIEALPSFYRGSRFWAQPVEPDDPS